MEEDEGDDEDEEEEGDEGDMTDESAAAAHDITPAPLRLTPSLPSSPRVAEALLANLAQRSPLQEALLSHVRSSNSPLASSFSAACPSPSPPASVPTMYKSKSGTPLEYKVVDGKLRVQCSPRQASIFLC